MIVSGPVGILNHSESIKRSPKTINQSTNNKFLGLSLSTTSLVPPPLDIIVFICIISILQLLKSMSYLHISPDLQRNKETEAWLIVNNKHMEYNIGS